ncbi:MAG: hypothetical protein HY328_12795 [Chloroflexi bacterium]|nr:hypothetical protein [Chloroflexota bacterium]
MTQAITIELPDGLYTQLEKTAALSRQPIDKIIAQSLAHSLPPVLQDIPPQYQADVFPLLEMDLAGLLAETERNFPSDKWEEYESLLDKKKQTALSSAEVARLDSLRYEADLLTLRKGYAAVLLKRRGYQAPPLTGKRTVQ